MVKEYIVKEISTTIDLKRDFDNQLKKGDLSKTKVKDLQRLVSEQEDKLNELQKIYDFIEKAEQYQNLEVYGMNYADMDSSIYQNVGINKIENERQELALDLHISIAHVLQQVADKAKRAAELIDTNPDKAKEEINTVETYIREFVSQTNQEVINIQTYRTGKGFSNSSGISESHRSAYSDISSSGQAKLDLLTKREKDVLRSIAKGMSNKEIGSILNISERTVKNHVSNVFKKIDVMDRTQAALFAIKNNFIDLF